MRIGHEPDRPITLRIVAPELHQFEPLVTDRRGQQRPRERLARPLARAARFGEHAAVHADRGRRGRARLHRLTHVGEQMEHRAGLVRVGLERRARQPSRTPPPAPPRRAASRGAARRRGRESPDTPPPARAASRSGRSRSPGTRDGTARTARPSRRAASGRGASRAASRASRSPRTPESPPPAAATPTAPRTSAAG